MQSRPPGHRKRGGTAGGGATERNRQGRRSRTVCCGRGNQTPKPRQRPARVLSLQLHAVRHYTRPSPPEVRPAGQRVTGLMPGHAQEGPRKIHLRRGPPGASRRLEGIGGNIARHRSSPGSWSQSGAAPHDPCGSTPTNLPTAPGGLSGTRFRSRLRCRSWFCVPSRLAGGDRPSWATTEAHEGESKGSRTRS